MNAPIHHHLREAFRSDERFLWGLCYRMTGSAADADDLVQDTFVRAIEKTPKRLDEPLRPWLVRVALNLSRDHLRQRRRRHYIGPWLPAAIETGDEESPPGYEPVTPSGETTEGRYDLLESVSFAFLLALEALTPAQRAVLLLRDVFDYSVRETGEALGMSEANVKTTHHRARHAMDRYDRERTVPTRTLQQKTRAALEAFLGSLVSQDVPAIEALLARDVCTLSDGGGEFAAALQPIVGRAKIMRFYLKTAARRSATFVELRNFNGVPAAVLEFAPGKPKEGTRMLMSFDLDGEGKVKTIYALLASRKLARVRFRP